MRGENTMRTPKEKNVMDLEPPNRGAGPIHPAFDESCRCWPDPERFRSRWFGAAFVPLGLRSRISFGSVLEGDR